ncbi:MAG: hypothetical protein OEY31_05095 [Candidatus Bathyarchaeota archaeon]|nr:hypothetical protein [Candidatus Bathyarchaeota archaeon]
MEAWIIQGLHRDLGSLAEELNGMIDLELSFWLWQEIRMLRLNLAGQPEHLREAVMAYEEKLTFSLIEKGTMKDLLELVSENSRIITFLRKPCGSGYVWIEAFKRKRKRGKRKCIEVEGYWRKKRVKKT